MVHSGVADPGRRRPMLAFSASLAMHGTVVLIAVAVVGKRAASPPRPQVLSTPVEMVDAPTGAPAMPPKGTSPAAPPAPTVGKMARTARPKVQRSQPSPPASKESLADLTIGYDDPSNFAVNGPTKLDTAGEPPRRGIATGIQNQGGGSVATMNIPQPPVVSRARAPRPKFDYSNLRIPGASKFAGRVIKVVLTIDPRGRVRGLRLVQGVDRTLDRRTMAMVSDFEFEPALDDDGVAVPGTMACNIEIVEDGDLAPFESVHDRLRR